MSRCEKFMNEISSAGAVVSYVGSVNGSIVFDVFAVNPFVAVRAAMRESFEGGFCVTFRSFKRDTVGGVLNGARVSMGKKEGV